MNPHNTVVAMCTAWVVALIAAIVFAWPASADEPIELIGKTRVTFEWTPASGPVYSYAVFVNWNSEGYSDIPDRLVSDNEATITAEYGDMISVRVAARDDDGNQGPLSEESESVIFLPPIADEPPEEDPDPIPVPTPEPIPFPLPEPSLVVLPIDHGNPREECEARGLLFKKTILLADGTLKSRCSNRKGE